MPVTYSLNTKDTNRTLKTLPIGKDSLKTSFFQNERLAVILSLADPQWATYGRGRRTFIKRNQMIKFRT